ncbi:hypothetical protein MishRS11D_26640 [Methylomagnum ishizawai]|nr:hypothetical protein MishRS11D_26640 [Methylomagnum ishizawai]
MTGTMAPFSARDGTSKPTAGDSVQSRPPKAAAKAAWNAPDGGPPAPAGADRAARPTASAAAQPAIHRKNPRRVPAPSNACIVMSTP